VGVGFLAIPTLAGSTAYAFAETLGWRQGLDKDLKQARGFYALILLSTGVRVGLDFLGINPVKALYWMAVINGLLAPFFWAQSWSVASDSRLMQGQPSSRLGWTVVAINDSGNVRRRHSDVCCIDRRSQRRRDALRTVQFGPVERFFPAYPLSNRADEQSRRSAILWPRRKENTMTHGTNKPAPKLCKAPQSPRPTLGRSLTQTAPRGHRSPSLPPRIRN